MCLCAHAHSGPNRPLYHSYACSLFDVQFDELIQLKTQLSCPTASLEYKQKDFESAAVLSVPGEPVSSRRGHGATSAHPLGTHGENVIQNKWFLCCASILPVSTSWS